MFGIGAQEILFLLCCAGVPLTAVALVFAVLRLAARGRAGASGTVTDFDDENP